MNCNNREFRVWNKKEQHYEIRCLLLSSTGQLYNWNERGNIEHLSDQEHYEVEPCVDRYDEQGRPIFINDIGKCDGVGQNACSFCAFKNLKEGRTVNWKMRPTINCRPIRIIGNARIKRALRKGDEVRIRDTGEICKIQFYEDIFDKGCMERYYLLEGHTERFSKNDLIKIDLFKVEGN